MKDRKRERKREIQRQREGRERRRERRERREGKGERRERWTEREKKCLGLNIPCRDNSANILQVH